ncbi:MAG: NAD(P)/FAD-dependent oxidoreductase [Massiliimalia sp.]|jgi:uncharacterized FAD-dependent dehydrogenase
MAICMNNIKIKINEPDTRAIEKAVHTLGLSSSQVTAAHLYKKSLDARKQDQIRFVCSVLLETQGVDEAKLCRRCKDASLREKTALSFDKGTQKPSAPIFIAGFGPAGMFCAYTLAKEGYYPIVLERGYDVDQRVQAVEGFWRQRNLDPRCNVQFGEGGAGTFSDGKLTTRISDSRCDYVLQLFSKFGAPEEILWKAKPHIGTDHLRGVVKALRQEIIRLGGQVRFASQLEDLKLVNGKLREITVNGETLPAEALVLAVGHSARDTFSMLLERGISMIPKNFSVGVRAEHLQTEINRGLYGKAAESPYLPVGEYQLSYRENGRGVYTFCMCPGGFVVPSSSSQGTVVTNGMSEFQRNQKNANAAVVVSVGAEDFGSHPMDGVKFQEQLERRAFELAGKDYTAPAVDLGSFLRGEKGLSLGRVQPSYALGVSPVDFDTLFPHFVSDMLRKGFRNFGRKLPGYDSGDTILTGVETRTSSPVRMMRSEENLKALGLDGVYPCGEGAGYAGGIMSAAVDGIRVAEQIMKQYSPE